MPRRTVRRTTVVAPLVLAWLVAGCGTGGPSAPVAPAAPAGATPAAPTGSAPGSPVAGTSAIPTPVPAGTLAGPPLATLGGEALPGEPAVGELGSFTWVDEGSDAPWIVPATGVVATPGMPVGVTFEPPAAASSWIARWAPIAAGGPGEVDTSAEGTGPVTIGTPGAAGAWSLQVESRFGAGRSATWYWRVDVE